MATKRANGAIKKCKKLIAEGAPAAARIRGKKAVINVSNINITLVRYTGFFSLSICCFVEDIEYIFLLPK
ncbi:MAG: hypothetical protein ACFB2X_21355 [Rivularia sp. (in: cyanobacteria)]